jgi:hypothetical protein
LGPSLSKRPEDVRTSVGSSACQAGERARQVEELEVLVLERMTLSEERLKECWTTLREVIADLRSFVETDDYSFIEMAKERVSALSGMRDLINNVREMYRKVLEANGKLDDIDHGLLVQQAIYSITRANILAVGIEFRLKRMRGG